MLRHLLLTFCLVTVRGPPHIIPYMQGVEFGFETFKGDAERRLELAALKAEEDALNAEVT